MVDWTSGKPNARFAVLELIKNNFAPGDNLSQTEIRSNGSPAEADAIEAQAFTRGSQRRLLLINERSREIVVELPKECIGAAFQTIGGTSPDLVKRYIGGTKIRLLPRSVVEGLTTLHRNYDPP